MRKFRIAMVAAGLIASVFAVGTSSAGADDNGGGANGCSRQLAEVAHGFDQAFADRDINHLMSYYDQDATLINPFGSILRGKDAVRTSLGGLLSQTFTSTVTPVLTTIDDCRTAVVTNKFALYDPSDSSTLTFLATLSLTRKHGDWLILMDQSTLLSLA